LALLVTDITNSFWTTAARGVEDEAAAQNYAVFLCNTDEDPAKENRYLEMLTRWRVDGLLIGPTLNSAAVLSRLQTQGIKFVLIDRTVDGIAVDTVRSDSRGGAANVTQHLLTTGHQRVAFIGGPLTTSTGRDRLTGYRAAHMAAGLAIDPDLIKIGSYHRESGRELTVELLAAERRPTAIFAGNNQIALGVLDALSEARVHLPDEMAVISFDDLPGGDGYGPFMTAVIQPAYQIGRIATQLLLARIAEARDEIEEIVLPTQLVIRRSCGCKA
jgi:DNA-binding LacI/PurR family transcriptional regulator